MSQPFRRLPALALALAVAMLAVALSACTETSAPTTATPAAPAEAEPTFITVTMTEFAFDLTAASAPAGPVLFQALNAGTIAHELVVIHTDLPHDGLPVVDGHVDLDVLDVRGEVEDIGPTQTESLRLELEAGAYVLICDVPGHYLAGMHVPFTVQ